MIDKGTSPTQAAAEDNFRMLHGNTSPSGADSAAPYRRVDPLIHRLDDMTVEELTYCLIDLRRLYADAVKRRVAETADLRRKVAERDYELAGRGLTRARREYDEVLGIRPEEEK